LYNISANTLFMGKQVIYLPTCHSTNDTAAEKILQGEVFEGAVVITSHQTAGRGQRGNSWEAAPNQNLTFSLILQPRFLKAADQYALNIAIAVGVSGFLTKYFTESIKIKWPNDIYYENKKLGGILIENTVKAQYIEHSIVGIGLNINQSDFYENRAVSMKAISGKEYSLKQVLGQLLESLEKNYLFLRNGHHDILKSRYLQNLYKYQEVHLFEDETGKIFAGKIIGIDKTGRLVVEVENKLQYFSFKEIKFL
jgi:BirA family biotin operon repressor/biotin-[acetyl-CoA-carboxylase] ligase